MHVNHTSWYYTSMRCTCSGYNASSLNASSFPITLISCFKIDTARVSLRIMSVEKVSLMLWQTYLLAILGMLQVILIFFTRCPVAFTISETDVFLRLFHCHVISLVISIHDNLDSKFPSVADRVLVLKLMIN
jgi:hypothetical protein